ncbi:MAG TPA: hypothetical protein VF604_14385 [Pyrinomonadaceae bacterium]
MPALAERSALERMGGRLFVYAIAVEVKNPRRFYHLRRTARQENSVSFPASRYFTCL